jgi:hypothetical protein
MTDVLSEDELLHALTHRKQGHMAMETMIH